MEPGLACTVCGMEQQRWGSLGTVDAILNAVKCNLTKLTTKRSWPSSGSQWFLDVSSGTVQAQCRRSAVHHSSMFKCSIVKWFFGRGASYFALSSSSPPSSCLFPCYFSVIRACFGGHGWVVQIAIQGSVLLSRCWLISVEAPRHPRHPSSKQLDAVVNFPIG